jgi:hypothetical protein
LENNPYVERTYSPTSPAACGRYTKKLAVHAANTTNDAIPLTLRPRSAP